MAITVSKHSYQERSRLVNKKHFSAQHTDLGLSIIGCFRTTSDYSDEIGTSPRVIIHQVTPIVQPSVKLRGEVHFVCKTQVKEVNLTDIIKVLELDIVEHTKNDLLFPGKTLSLCQR